MWVDEVAELLVRYKNEIIPILDAGEYFLAVKKLEEIISAYRSIFLHKAIIFYAGKTFGDEKDGISVTSAPAFELYQQLNFLRMLCCVNLSGEVTGVLNSICSAREEIIRLSRQLPVCYDVFELADTE